MLRLVPLYSSESRRVQYFLNWFKILWKVSKRNTYNRRISELKYNQISGGVKISREGWEETLIKYQEKGYF